ncbi:DISARM system helicase DrmA [Candidatus Chloroploca sp. M-50]|uniref:DISARM system helicase DrmA n=2 Tax=Candidatus Chloroploca mongolica TaxID=2528176 RepID=A0ABS4DG45_9CHLR|nr:DISARM system helicase DrmA [Candidatus Chloroploca mongolica]
MITSTTELTIPSLAVRAQLIEALHLDLVGPSAGHALTAEQLPEHVRPATWYLTGFLIPSGTPAEQASDPDEDDEAETVPTQTGIDQEANDDRRAAKKGFFPSSIGLTFLVAAPTQALQVIVRWGDYHLVPLEDAPEVEPAPDAPTQAGKEPTSKAASQVWQRTQREELIRVTLTGQAHPAQDVPHSHGLQYQVIERPLDLSGMALPLPPGTRSVSVYVINNRTHHPDQPDTRYAFQAQIEVMADHPFVPRPNLSGIQAEAWDDMVADLHYADVPEYAVGHGVAADWALTDGRCQRMWSTWIPRASVEKTETVDVPEVEVRMDVLGALRDGDAAVAALGPLVAAYRAWIGQQQAATTTLRDLRRETAATLLHHAALAATRIERGIQLLAHTPDALDAFCTANRAVARALTQRLGIAQPRWRAFQLAFILLNLPGLADPLDQDRGSADLLFFPTGGGKTEAYLGLAAFAMVLRRLRQPGDAGTAGLGVSVIMRYTLRLLTLDQLSRAAGLVCALELERAAAPDRYGRWPFEIGLWVGKAATPNMLGEKGDKRDDTARALVRRYQSNPKGNPSPIPLENCPWCNTRFTTSSFSLRPNADKPTELRIVCSDFTCDFSGARPLPIVAVDEMIYRRLPAFLIATVDKFASLPWVGPSGALLGGADRYDASGFYGASEPKRGQPLGVPLAPPDLIIQDELHLISGPLGTMAGLYETAIDALCTRTIDGQAVGPKIIASTATVRRAQDQILALFGRTPTHIFPPPGPDRHDAFFARTAPSHERPARQYLGIAAQGRSPKVMMRKVWLALMGAAQRAYLDAGGDRTIPNPADPYMTVLGYFNNLRELGGARRILEEEVQTTVKSYGRRMRVNETQGLFADRPRFSEVIELTSRVATNQVADARRRLDLPFHHLQDRVDCALATNMISVGLDIQRLGLMLVIGQPMLTAEYIQATSRVGRDDRRPGLVVTLLNVHKPRDRSHYERFRTYHETFYRSVEASSVTPFAARALDRGFAGALVALARHSHPDLTPPRGVEQVAVVRAAIEHTLMTVFRDRIARQEFADVQERDERLLAVQNRIVDLLDAWQTIIATYHDAGVAVQYQPFETRSSAKPLLRNTLEQQFASEHERKFRASRSLRDVEPDVNLFLRDVNNQPVED